MNVWIYDELADIREPMFNLFEKEGLVRVVNTVLSESELNLSKGAKSTKSEWCTKGQHLLDDKRYYRLY